jgi:hypothetical protein
VPLVATDPLHPPEATQDVASVDDHVSVELPPVVTTVGFAVRVTVGTGGGAAVTLIVTLVCTWPPCPEQLRMYVLDAVRTPVLSLPDSATLPDHAPEAAQDVVLVEDQVSVALPPDCTEVAEAVSETCGAFGPG